MVVNWFIAIGYWFTVVVIALRHCSMSHFGVLVAPQMPTVQMFLSHVASISSGPSIR